MEIIPEKGPPTGNVGLKYVVRSTVLPEEDLTEVSEMEGMRSTLQISDLRGSDTANVSLFHTFGQRFCQRSLTVSRNLLHTVHMQSPERTWIG